MALSFSTVQKTYEIFNGLKTVLPNLSIPSWPEDMGEWDEDKRKNPPVLRVTGWGKKSDDGWENIMFFIEDPSEELLARLEELRKEIKIPNTHMCEKYSRNENLWIIGWF